MISKQALIDEYVEGVMLRMRQTRPAGPMTLEEENANRARIQMLGSKLLDDFASKEATYERLRNGMFRTENRSSRRMFTKVTGVELPLTYRGTKEAIINFLGRDWVAEQEEKARLEFEAEMKREEDERQARYAEQMQEIADRAKRGHTITGRELTNLARHLGIQVHPRTAGSASNVEWINNERAGVRKQCNVQGVFRLLRDVLEELNREPESEEVSCLAKQLFQTS
ncbi:hypothetical protein SH501x_000836 [Pirellulaceae bacterium SH501]